MTGGTLPSVGQSKRTDGEPKSTVIGSSAPGRTKARSPNGEGGRERERGERTEQSKISIYKAATSRVK